MSKKNLILLLLAVALAVVPLTMKSGGSFTGSDDQAKAMITQIDPNYHPWFAPLWTPPSSEVESLIFALQAALGAGFIGYFFGSRRSRQKTKEDDHAVSRLPGPQ
jgi:cobalt/nickel transport protein